MPFRARPLTARSGPPRPCELGRPPQQRASKRGPLGPTLRANPFPEVTDLFCRLPLSTLFYRLEAAHLGDLRRFRVRPDVRISHATGFSRIVGIAPDNTKNMLLCQLIHLIAGQSDSKVYQIVKKKRELFLGLPPMFPISLVLPLIIHVLVQEY